VLFARFRAAISNPACHCPPNGLHLGPDWLHEIKHDGFRIIARRDANGVRLYISQHLADTF
jgi:ATP-dependent DNA ligase